MRILDQFEYSDTFSEAEQAIIQWILLHKEAVLPLSTNALAQKTFTSPATIVRLCQKLGLKGYNDFKIKLSGEFEYLAMHKGKVDVNYPFNKEDDLKTISQRLAQLSKDSMEETLALLDYEELEKIVNTLYNAKQIDVYATSFPLSYAVDFQLRMMHIGVNVNLCQLHGEPVFQALNTNADHCVIVISYSGQTSSLIDIMKIVEKTPAKIISITSIGNNPIVSHSHYHLRVSSREKIRSKIANYSSHASITLLLDILYSAYFSKQYEKNVIYKVSREKKIDLRRSNLITIDD